MLPASDGQRPGILLIVLQCTGQTATTNDYPAQLFSSTEVEKRCTIYYFIQETEF